MADPDRILISRQHFFSRGAQAASLQLSAACGQQFRAANAGFERLFWRAAKTNRLAACAPKHQSIARRSFDWGGWKVSSKSCKSCFVSRIFADSAFSRTCFLSLAFGIAMTFATAT